VVLSVLWIVAVPTYLFFDHNSNASDRRRTCLDLETKYAPELGFDQIWDKCNQQAGFMSLSDLVNAHDAWVLWLFFVLLPFVLFWILGGVTFWTVFDRG
jgi:hypothetical protein